MSCIFNLCIYIYSYYLYALWPSRIIIPPVVLFHCHTNSQIADYMVSIFLQLGRGTWGEVAVGAEGLGEPVVQRERT